jgi:flagellin
MQINKNLNAMFAHRQIQLAFRRTSKSIEKLSTGMRINRAGDDATNLAVSEKMRTQIRGLKQAERNAQNGLSFIQVAESGMVQVNDILQRIRELSVQAGNGIYSEQDRQQIQLEVSQLIDEVDRISTTVEFNRRKILTGDYSPKSTRASMFFHVGPNQDQRIRAYVATMNAKALGFYQTNQRKKISTVGEANAMIGTVDIALDQLNRQRADLGAYYNRIELTAQALRSTYENMVAAESRIRDTDIAEELIEFTKNKLLVQSSTAMLAQANFSSRQVMQLLENSL